MPTRWVGRVLLVPVWLFVLALAALVLARVVAFDERRLLVLADAYALWIFLPVYLILAAAICFRSRALAVVSAVVVVAHVAWVVPPVFRGVDRPAGASEAPRLRLVAANVRFDNREFDPMLDELASYDADVLVLSEITPEWWRHIEDHGLVRTHPYMLREPAWGAAGMAILSKVELRDRDIIRLDDRSVPNATIRVGGRNVRLLGVHTIAPNYAYAKNQEQQDAVTRILRDAPRPRLVAGDFNATPSNRWYGQLLDLGLAEVHETVGEPFATTWPNGTRPLPPVRIDHVFADDPIVPLRVFQGDGEGSDHRPVIADLAVLPPSR